MNRKRLKIFSIFTLLLVCIVTVHQISYATLKSQDKLTNKLNLGDIDIEVRENFTPPKNWNGEEYSKEVEIQNNSKSPALIRVSIIPRWIDENGNAWAGDSDLVTLNYETKNIIANQNTINTDKWIYGNDNYYYYNSIVPTGDKTSAILKSVSANIPEELKERYKNKTLVVDVKSEAVQSTKDAYKKSWSNIGNKEVYNILENLCTR